MILAGDIGGTNTRLALFDDKMRPVGTPRKHPTGDGSKLESQIKDLLKRAGRPVERACLAIAGPVIEGVCTSTNIGRTFREEEIRRKLGLKSLTLINDLVANASGIELLDKSEVKTLLKGEKHAGTRAVVSPGTGLGEGTLAWDGRYHRPMPSEGGHTRFSPNNAEQRELHAFLQERFGSVIVEHVISGRGIGNIYDYFVARGDTPSPAVVRKLAKTDPLKRGAVISAAALDGSCKVCAGVMNLFVDALGVECANMAVKVFAIGGVYVGGGIPPKILPLLTGARFKKAFLTHPTMTAYLRRVPVRLILNDDTALEGAALYGYRFG